MKKILIFAVILVIAVLPFAGCSKTDDTIRINEVTHSLFYAPFYLADSLGLFEQNGINIELTNGGGSDASMTALLSGNADVALCGPETTIYVYQQGKQDFPMPSASLRPAPFPLGNSTPSPSSPRLQRGGRSVTSFQISNR